MNPRGPRIHRTRTATGPFGCLLGLLLLPVVVVSSLFLMATAWWRLRKLRRQLENVGSRAPSASPASERENALCTYVRGLALDPEFTRDEALEVPVVASGGLAAAELLDEACHRGWIAERGDALRVTDTGRDAAERHLAQHGP